MDDAVKPPREALEAAEECRREGRRIYNRERAKRSLAECENEAFALALDRSRAEERERMAALERVAESARLLLDELMAEGEASAETQDDLLVELRALDDTAIDAALSGEPS